MALWTPANDGSRVWAWYDASLGTASGNITQTSGAVSAWADVSGNGRNTSQATSGNQPTYSATAFNGSPGILFSYDDGLYVTGLSVTAGTIINVFAALYDVKGLYNVTGPVGMFTNGRVISFSQGSNDYASPSIIPILKNGDNQVLTSYIGGVGFSTSQAAYPLSTATVAAATFTSSAHTQWADGTASAAFSNTYPSTFSPTNLALGNFADAVAFGGLTGVMGEAVFVTGAMTTADIDKYFGYLNWKWSAQSRLPGGHPYASAAPTIGGSLLIPPHRSFHHLLVR